MFASPNDYVGRDLKLAGDVQSLEACRETYADVMGKTPPSFPMPTWLLERFVGSDILTMWPWLRTGEFEFDTSTAKAVHPHVLTAREWLERSVRKSDH